MPTTNANNPTDTNNNSNNKITNGHAQEVTLVVPAMMSGAGALVAGALATPGGAASALEPNAAGSAPIVGPGASGGVNVNALNQSAAAAAASNNDLISSIKQHEQQQHPIVLNNNNVNHHNNNIGKDNGGAGGRVAPVRQQRQHQLLNNMGRGGGGAPQLRVASGRSAEELTRLIRDFNFDRTLLSNEELIKLVKSNQISIYKLENFLGKDNAARCVEIRRDFYRLELDELDKRDSLGIRDRADALLNDSKFNSLDYDRVNGACCENVIGHVKVPVGLAGPLILDGEPIFVPLATTEGCLVASTCRGLSALRKSGGVTSRIRRDFMTRAPIVRFNDVRLKDALDNVERAIRWLNDRTNKEKMRAAFNLTSSHGRFIDYTMYPVNREIHVRFEAQTGDAMGMNMCSKGVESALKEMQRAFPTMEIVTLSGNMCTDKKAAGINWINGRGKAVECNAELPAQVVKQVFKVTVDQLVDRWKSKVMIGSALAASIGGFNSQAANILTAIFIATGQDPAQNVTSSNCMLILEKDSKGSLVVCCTMPSIECGTVGGGTILGDQSRYLQMMGVRGPTPKQINNLSRRNDEAEALRLKHLNSNGNDPASGGSRILSSAQSYAAASSTATSSGGAGGAGGPQSSIPQVSHLIDTNAYTNARKLARIICATVMAGELSLLAALTEGTLVKSHMRHNRSSNNVLGGPNPPTEGDNSSGAGGSLEANGVGGGAGSGGGGGGGTAGGPLNAHSCFGPLGSINNTTVISNHRNLAGGGGGDAEEDEHDGEHDGAGQMAAQISRNLRRRSNNSLSCTSSVNCNSSFNSSLTTTTTTTTAPPPPTTTTQATAAGATLPPPPPPPLSLRPPCLNHSNHSVCQDAAKEFKPASLQQQQQQHHNHRRAAELQVVAGAAGGVGAAVAGATRALGDGLC